MPGMSVDVVERKRIIAIATKTTAQTISGTASADVTGLSLTFVEPVGYYWLKIRSNIVQQADAADDINGTLEITDGSNVQIAAGADYYPAITNARGQISVDLRVLGTGATVTRKVRGATNSAGGDMNLNASATAPIYFFAEDEAA